MEEQHEEKEEFTKKRRKGLWTLGMACRILMRAFR